jgi:hypothetical protein
LQSLEKYVNNKQLKLARLWSSALTRDDNEKYVKQHRKVIHRKGKSRWRQGESSELYLSPERVLVFLQEFVNLARLITLLKLLGRKSQPQQVTQDICTATFLSKR